ncbi:hypothetical protein SCLCIDRAFT_472232 [Scleroderma citrinum Foug A]|uniref:Uncharacterized protein n=1 Tax=Scleroderma citrinum Foug A TaxID=1036808 RepID=A0A0C2ZVK5_9AGAM|nr:hypothetical protein SCLCIDRAFT_472232 [Scleroderma citrinum Foug A]
MESNLPHWIVPPGVLRLAKFDEVTSSTRNEVPRDCLLPFLAQKMNLLLQEGAFVEIEELSNMMLHMSTSQDVSVLLDIALMAPQF